MSCEGRIYEMSSERQITGRRPIKIILHEIMPSRDQWQANGISWDETYTRQNLDSVAGMSICVEFIDDERKQPFGHGLTEIRDNLPLMENATMVGHCDRGYITDVEIDGVTRRVLAADGTLDEMRYPRFVEWLRSRLAESRVDGSVEIVGRAENNNRIIYDGGWKEQGRVPQVYDYGGYAILGVRPADDAAIVMELNNRHDSYREDRSMVDEQVMAQLVESAKTAVSEAVAEFNSKWDEYFARVQEKDAEIAQLKAEIAAKEAEIAQLRADFEAQEAKTAMAEAGLAETNAEVETLRKEKKLAELNSALAGYTPAERELAKDEIAAFQADPVAYEINSITSKICVEMVRRSKEAQSQSAAAPDIFGGVTGSTELEDVDIY